MEETTNTGTIESVTILHEEAAAHFLNEAHRLGDEIQEIGEAFKNPGLYPFELTNVAILLSIAHGVQALNNNIGALVETMAIMTDPDTLAAIAEAQAE